MEKQNLVLIGGGGHCKVCIDVIEQEARYNIIGILDNTRMVGELVLSYPIIGTDAMMSELSKDGCSFLVTVGQIRSSHVRATIFNQLRSLGADVATVISPRASVSQYASIGQGTIVMPRACVNADAVIGSNNIINTGSTIEHDAVTGDHVHISTHAVINGACSIGSGSFIGSNATLVNGIRVTTDVVVGAGVVVFKDIVDSGVYYGNPFRKLRR